MLLKDPIYYYSRIREHYKNSYLAEDTLQVIIGIDCEYVDSYEHNYKSLEQFYKSQKSIAPFAGLFGTFAYETIQDAYVQIFHRTYTKNVCLSEIQIQLISCIFIC